MLGHFVLHRRIHGQVGTTFSARASQKIAPGCHEIQFDPKPGAYWPMRRVAVSTNCPSTEHLCVRIRNNNPDFDFTYKPAGARSCVCMSSSDGNEFLQYDHAVALPTGQWSVEVYSCSQRCSSGEAMPNSDVFRADFQIGMWPSIDYNFHLLSQEAFSVPSNLEPVRPLVIAIILHAKSSSAYRLAKSSWLNRVHKFRTSCEIENAEASFVIFVYTSSPRVAQQHSEMVLINGRNEYAVAMEAIRHSLRLFANASYFIRLEAGVFLFPDNLAQEMCRRNPNKKELLGFLMRNDEVEFPSLEAGYVLSREAIASCDLACNDTVREDLGIAACLTKQCNIEVKRMFGLNPDTPEKMLQWAARPLVPNYRSNFPLDKDGVWHIPAPITYYQVGSRWMHLISGRLDGIVEDVPKNIHRIWMDRPNGQTRPRLLSDSCKLRNPGWDLHTWNLCNLKDLSQDKQSPHQSGFVLEDMLRSRGWPSPALNLASSDMIRIELLYRLGACIARLSTCTIKSCFG